MGTQERWIRTFAAIDLVLTAPLALPLFAVPFFDLLQWVDTTLGFETVWRTLDAFGWLFVHLAGVLGVLWALARLATPTRFLAALDAAGRGLVTGLMLHAMRDGASPVFALFVASELIGAIVQGLLVTRPR